MSLGSLSRSLNWRLRLLKKFTTLSTTSVSRLVISSSPADLAEDMLWSTSFSATAGSLTSRTPSNNSISGCSLIRSRAVNNLCLIHGPNCGKTRCRSCYYSIIYSYDGYYWAEYEIKCRLPASMEDHRLTCAFEQSWNTLNTTLKSPRPVSILRASGCSATTDEDTIATKNMTAADLDIAEDNI